MLVHLIIDLFYIFRSCSQPAEGATTEALMEGRGPHTWGARSTAQDLRQKEIEVGFKFSFVFLYVQSIRIILCCTDFRILLYVWRIWIFGRLPYVIFSDRAKIFFVALLASHNPKTTKKMSVCLSVPPLSVCPTCIPSSYWSLSSCLIAFYFHMWII